jgi:hypothetical protein
MKKLLMAMNNKSYVCCIVKWTRLPQLRHEGQIFLNDKSISKTAYCLNNFSCPAMVSHLSDVTYFQLMIWHIFEYTSQLILTSKRLNDEGTVFPGPLLPFYWNGTLWALDDQWALSPHVTIGRSSATQKSQVSLPDPAPEKSLIKTDHSVLVSSERFWELVSSSRCQ